MRMFYGFRRSPKDAPDDCEKVWLDTPETGRQERADMILSLRRETADVVVVLARSDLGHGAEIPAIVEKIEAKGATVEVHEVENEPPKRRGPPPKFQPTEDQDRKIRALWRSYNARSYVHKRAQEIAGEPVAWHQLKRRYGNRWKK